jgi:DNA primase catalytic core
MWYCHACGKGGDIISYVREADGLSFIEAVDLLSNLAGLQPLNLSDDERKKYDERTKHHAVLHKVNSAFVEFCMQEAGKNLAEFKHYIEDTRGLTLELVKKYRVGYIDSDVPTVRKALISAGCTVQEIDESMILDNSQLFKKRIIIGVVNHKQVRFVYGRTVDDSEPHHVYQSGSEKVLFNLDRTNVADKIIVVESILDALALIQLGFEHETVGAMGARMTDGQLHDLRRTGKKIWFLYDNDKAGLESAIEMGLQVNAHHAIARLKGKVKDPNDFLKAGGTRSEIEQLLEESKGNAAHKLMVVAIDPGTPRHELPKALEPVLNYLAHVDDEIAARAMLEDDVKKHFKLSAAEIGPYRQKLQAMRAKVKRESDAADRAARSDAPLLPENATEVHELHNGVSYVDGNLWFQFLIQRPEKFVDPKTHVEKMVKTTEVWYIASDRVFKNRASQKIEDDIIIDNTPVGIRLNRWETAKSVPNSIEAWRKKEEQVDAGETFRTIRDLLKTYLWFKDEVRESYYDLLTCWVFMTYWTPVFDTVGYLFLHASPRSGKTTTMTILAHLAYEAELMGDVSGSALFRKIEGSRGAMLLDEMEKLASEEFARTGDAINQVLLTGYKRTGNTQRTDLDQKTETTTGVQTFSTYCPKIIANTQGIKVQTIRDRSIELELLRSDHRIPQFNERRHDKQGTFSALRNQLYCIALKYVDSIVEIYEDRLEDKYEKEIESKGLWGRDYEVWSGIWTVAVWLDEQQAKLDDQGKPVSIMDGLLELATIHKVNRDSAVAEDSIDAPLLKALRRFVREHRRTIAEVKFNGEQEWYTKQAVVEYLRQYPRLSKISESRLLEIMRRVNVIANTTPGISSVGGKTVSVIKVTEQKVLEAVKRYDIGEDDILMRDESLEEFEAIDQDEKIKSMSERFS